MKEQTPRRTTNSPADKTGNLNDLPARGSTHRTEGLAVAAFRSAVESADLFIVQGEDRHDYGTDIHLEAVDGSTITNARVQAQIKGTAADANSDQTVSISVARTNLNYLLLQPDSFYICLHIPTGRLLVRYAARVLDGYAHGNSDWQKQKAVTVRFDEEFDETFQRTLHGRVLGRHRALRDERTLWSATPPQDISKAISSHTPLIEVPADTQSARALLLKLYEQGQDAVISRAFAQFAACIGSDDSTQDLLYMAETNLAMSNQDFARERIQEWIHRLEARNQGSSANDPAEDYNKGNAHFALEQHDAAQRCYNICLQALASQENNPTTPQCHKNLGTLLERIGEIDAAKNHYEQALALDANLDHAHFALALWHHRHANDAEAALHHLDAISQLHASNIDLPAIQGWRMQLLFVLERHEEAFRELNSLRTHSYAYSWIQPWCERMVATFGRANPATLTSALRFWRSVSDPFDAQVAQHEAFFILSRLRFLGPVTGVSFDAFVKLAEELTSHDHPQLALIWDRVGHWAQSDGNWELAEHYYRKAYDIDPESFAYCLGTSLIFIDRKVEALPILETHVASSGADAMSWFQLAVAREGTGNITGAAEAYNTAIQLDPSYDHAWFNLGGVYWNSGSSREAKTTWLKALELFPNSHLAPTVRRILHLE